METIIRVIQSILDNTPYIHEPGLINDENYNNYVKFETYNTLLLEYIKYEKDEKLLNFMTNYLKFNKEIILEDLNKNTIEDGTNISTKYGMKSIINYKNIIEQFKQIV